MDGTTVRAALLQIDVDPGETAGARRERVADLVRAEHGADLVVLPELWTVGAFDFERFDAHAEPLAGPTAAAMGAAARDAAVWLHAGSIVERGPDGTLRNTSLLFGPDGHLRGTYRKIHRFSFDRGEAALMAAGQEVVTAQLTGTGLTAAWPPATTCASPSSSGCSSTPVPISWSSRPYWPRGGARTGHCWRVPARWSHRRTSWPATPRAHTPGWIRPGTAWSSTRGARWSPRRAPGSRCSGWSWTRIWSPGPARSSPCCGIAYWACRNRCRAAAPGVPQPAWGGRNRRAVARAGRPRRRTCRSSRGVRPPGRSALVAARQPCNALSRARMSSSGRSPHRPNRRAPQARSRRTAAPHLFPEAPPRAALSCSPTPKKARSWP